MVLNAAAVKSPTTFTGGLFDNALGFDDIPDLYPSFTTPPFSEGSGLSINDSTNSSTLLMAPTPAYWDVHHGMTTEPVKPKQPPWDIYHPAATLVALLINSNGFIKSFATAYVPTSSTLHLMVGAMAVILDPTRH